MSEPRYYLIEGASLLICDSRFTARNPVFKLASSDRRYARQLLANLNATGAANANGFLRRAIAGRAP